MIYSAALDAAEAAIIRRAAAEASAATRNLDVVRLKARHDLMQSAAASLWSWQSGYSGTGWSGDKFAGALTYPANWWLDHQELRRRARIAKWDSVQARSLGNRLETNVVGTGLTLEATPAWGIVGERSEAAKQAWTRDTETRFHLWARSKQADVTGRLTFYGLTSLVYRTAFDDGELFAILRYNSDRSRMSPLGVQLVDADAIQTPPKVPRDKRVTDGIELDPDGAEIAYHVQDAKTGKTTRIPIAGTSSGRRFVLHVGAPSRPGEVRAISGLAPIIHELQKITDYTIAEIEAAVINASFAATIETDPAGEPGSVLTDLVERDSSGEKTDAGDTRARPPAEGWFSKPGMFIDSLRKGQKLEAHDTTRPNVNFETFVKALMRSLSGSLGIPVEVLDMQFGQNYSASRATLILFWRTVEKARQSLADDFLNPVYEAWLGEEIAAGRIAAPGWDAPIMRAAWLNCDWIGTPQPNIDPRAEAAAAEQNIKNGLTTRTREARSLNGTEFAENAERLAVENEALSAANKPLAPPKPSTVPERTLDDGQAQQTDAMAARMMQLELGFAELRGASGAPAPVSIGVNVAAEDALVGRMAGAVAEAVAVLGDVLGKETAALGSAISARLGSGVQKIEQAIAAPRRVTHTIVRDKNDDMQLVLTTSEPEAK